MQRLLALVLTVSWIRPPSVVSQASPATTERVTIQEEQTRNLLPELPPLPAGNATLIGGVVANLDRIRNEITLQPFGGGRMKILFDGRTRIYRDSAQASPRQLRLGDRVSVDTVLDGNAVFAKNIRVQTRQASGESQGQIADLDPARGRVTVIDDLASAPVELRLTPNTRIMRSGQLASTADLRPGSLISLRFRPSGDGIGIVDEISILAAPGTAFTFTGRVIHLDMRTGLMALLDPSNKKSYEIHFDPARIQVNGNLQEGADVTTTAGFDGSRYVSTAVMVHSSPSR